ncbi:TetR/AcrR family transcriptional regulator [Thermogemmatispora tikiterensis]|uniref:HTH tetR-type domain-containing protein n=1 Tax=Thermogemmatispora tikiterensis TaxID=1825093 RepID=A0A328VEX5_9CHLR|nr:TetR/AcrR family transcriptional regulator [Thermogemmatispora tikiterensis]RAQ94093.1 hypothetical protein A4R35_01020 [Thermogemmatispora tikiterensis]
MTEMAFPHEEDREPRRLSGQERRRLLIQAAYRLIAERGFEYLRTREVAARAGVNVATLHYYFAGKEQLIQGVVEHLLEILSSRGPSQLSEAATPLEHIRSMFLRIDHLLHEEPEVFIVLSEISLRSLRDESLRRALHRLEAAWRAYLTPVVSEGLRCGMLRGDLNIEETVTGLIIVIKGLAFHAISGGSSPDIRRLLADLERWLQPAARPD